MTLEFIADRAVFFIGATWMIMCAVRVAVGILSKIAERLAYGMKTVEIIRAVLIMRRQKKAGAK